MNFKTNGFRSVERGSAADRTKKKLGPRKRSNSFGGSTMKVRNWSRFGAFALASAVCLLLTQVTVYSDPGRAFWHFDDTTGTTVPDHSNTASNPGTLVNGATTSTDVPFAYPGN